MAPPPSAGSQAFRLWLGLVSLVLVLDAAGAAPAATPKTVLFLQPSGPEKGVMAQFLDAFLEELKTRWPAPVGLMTEDIPAGLGHGGKLDDWLLSKYNGRRLDVIASVEGPGSDLGNSWREVLRPGMPVVVTGIGVARYRHAAAHPVRVAVVDFMMPSLNGLQVQESLRRLSPHTCVILISASDEPEVRLKAIAGGARAYFAKPFNEREFLDVVRLALIPAERPSP